MIKVQSSRRQEKNTVEARVGQSPDTIPRYTLVREESKLLCTRSRISPSSLAKHGPPQPYLGRVRRKRVIYMSPKPSRVTIPPVNMMIDRAILLNTRSLILFDSRIPPAVPMTSMGRNHKV